MMSCRMKLSISLIVLRDEPNTFELMMPVYETRSEQLDNFPESAFASFDWKTN